MPITQQAVITFTISSVTFKGDGSVTISLREDINGVFKEEKSFEVDPTTVSSLIDIPVPNGVTAREFIIMSVYNYLNSTGIIPGTIS